jgi:hypothetical protein
MHSRISPVNFRTREQDMDQLLALLEQECHRALQSMSGEKAEGNWN